jgi:hypothetical protein
LAFPYAPFVRCPTAWAVVAHLLALFVVVSQPVASLAWLGGMHTTPDQAAFHQAAVAHGHYHHHGALEHHEHKDDNTYVRFFRSILGPEFVSATPYAGTFHGLLQILFQAMLPVPAETPSPGEQPRFGSPGKDFSSQHSPSVPHRPPILLPLSLTIA